MRTVLRTELKNDVVMGIELHRLYEIGSNQFG